MMDGKSQAIYRLRRSPSIGRRRNLQRQWEVTIEASPKTENILFKSAYVVGILIRLVNGNCHLRELGFVCGSISDSGLGRLCTLVTTAVEKRLDRCRLTTLDLVNVEIQHEGYRMLVALVGEMPHLLQLSINGSIGEFDKKLLVDAALRVPTLERLFLLGVNLDDNAFDGLVEKRNPLALRDLNLKNNKMSFNTLGAICRATTDGVLNFENLTLDGNLLMKDPAICALAPMLASPVVGLATRLTRLNLSSANSVLKVLLACYSRWTVKHLNLAYNHFGVGFGDVLAHFLLVNSCIKDLNIDCVELELAGVSVGLLRILESNFALTSLSLEGNELRDRGASAILQALPFKLVNLSDNLITLDGLTRIADIFDSLNIANVTHVHADSTNERNQVNGSCRKRQRVENSDNSHRPSSANVVLVEELRLVRNNFIVNGRLGREYEVLLESIRRHVGHVEIIDATTNIVYTLFASV
ncbi:hypothetical protein PsorP6_018648 [Peronosclerospora sorghi]|nr:hypothetical protein PsorP6_018648 [Peronosclerospora sorghi]